MGVLLSVAAAVGCIVVVAGVTVLTASAFAAAAEYMRDLYE